MSEFTDHLWRDLVEEHGATLARVERAEPARGRGAGRAGSAGRAGGAGGVGVLRRPRLLAGSTLGLAGVATALVLALSGSSAPPAYAITTQGDGSVLVTINQDSALPQANAKLTAMGIHEQISIQMATGPATTSGPVTCVPQGANVSGPPVKAIVGTNGTEVIASGNTGAGTWHLAGCRLYSTSATGNTGAG